LLEQRAHLLAPGAQRLRVFSQDFEARRALPVKRLATRGGSGGIRLGSTHVTGVGTGTSRICSGLCAHPASRTKRNSERFTGPKR
jgi:hypothetical protein